MDAVDRQWIEGEFAARDRAVLLARAELEKNLVHLNKLREQTLDKEQYYREHERIRRDVEELRRWQANIMGRALAVGLIGALFVGAVGALVGHLAGG